jgi:hypothetical protein
VRRRHHVGDRPRALATAAGGGTAAAAAVPAAEHGAHQVSEQAAALRLQAGGLLLGRLGCRRLGGRCVGLGGHDKAVGVCDKRHAWVVEDHLRQAAAGGQGGRA